MVQGPWAPRRGGGGAQREAETRTSPPPFPGDAREWDTFVVSAPAVRHPAPAAGKVPTDTRDSLAFTSKVGTKVTEP